MYGDHVEEPDEELRALFDAALELEGEARAAFIAERTAGRPQVAAALTRLLAHHQELGDFLGRPWSAAPDGGVPASSLLAPGERLGAYLVEGLLGRGGGGQVYRARQESLGGRPVALKVVATAGMSTTDRERFLRGARMAAEVHHPHLAQVHDCGEDQARGLLFYSMRLIEGPDLQRLLEHRAGRPMSEPGARRELVARLHEVAGALAALHAQRLIHQDVKPGNVLIEGATPARPFAGRAVLVDFGLVKSVGSPAPISTVWATLPYAAPEVLLNRQADARSDVYAFGLCLYDLLAGCLPSERSGSSEDLAPLSRRCAGLERDLEAVVHRALELAPERRYAHAGPLAEDLGAWLAGRPVRARRLTRVELARRWVRARAEHVLRWGARGAAAAAGIALLALVLARVAGWQQAARAATEAHARGDVVALDQIARELPVTARELLVPDEALDVLEQLARPDTPFARVTRATREAGPDEGVRLAAGFAGRDGLARQPELARFLLDRLERRPERSDEERLQALVTVALLFHDHPTESPAELVRTAPFAERFARILRDPGLASAEDRLLAELHALTGLATTGGPEAVAEILAHLEETPRPSAEAVRLGFVGLEVLTRRSHACGFAAELFARDWDAWLARLCAAAARIDAAAGPIYGLPGAFSSLSTYVALARRRLGHAPLHGPACLEEESEVFRAANGDETVLDLLCDGSLLEDRGLDSPALVAGFAAIGQILASLGTSPGHARAVECVEEFLTTRAPPYAPTVLQHGIELVDLEWEVWPLGRRSDPDTRLGVRLDQPLVQTTFVHRRYPRPDASRPDAIAGWGFDAEGTYLFGDARSLTLVETPVRPDGDLYAFARLGNPGHSEVRLRFAHEWEEPKRSVAIRLSYQQGFRPLLPFGGRAVGVLSVPGDVERRFSASRSTSHTSYPLNLRHEQADGEYEVRIRLEPDSTTTLRLYEVLLHYE
ncbi:MAG TPA: serine/threonine-protein kinase [Planctomycetota bacterium]